MQSNNPSVLIIHNTYLYTGGEETVVAAEIESLKANGYKVYYKEYTNANFKFFNFKTLLAPFNTIFNIFSFFEIIYFIRINKIKIVHAHNIFYTASPSIFWAAKLAGAKTVITIHNYRLFCLSANFFRAKQTCFECSDKKSFKSGLQNKCFKNSLLASFTLALSIRLSDFLGTWKNKIDHYIVLNEFAKQLLINKGIDPKKIVLKSNFLSAYNLNQVTQIRDNFYLFAGRITEEKGIRHLMNTFTMTSKPLTIAGNGDMVHIINNNLSKNIKYIGLQSKAQIQSLLLTCKALIFPSIWIESMPMTLIEAQTMGTIPIVAASINTNNMIEHGIDGFLYDASKPNALMEAILHFESLSSIELDTISNNARNKSLKLYGEIAHVKKIKEIYGT
ncbi:MAG: glycosyltransferase family 4 protein [Sediminibacterium sp.]|nr:glycosyltransferase family 4 protein [Sediminibacterium sp.]